MDEGGGIYQINAETGGWDIVEYQLQRGCGCRDILDNWRRTLLLYVWFLGVLRTGSLAMH